MYVCMYVCMDPSYYCHICMLAWVLYSMLWELSVLFKLLSQCLLHAVVGLLVYGTVPYQLSRKTATTAVPSRSLPLGTSYRTGTNACVAPQRVIETFGEMRDGPRSTVIPFSDDGMFLNWYDRFIARGGKGRSNNFGRLGGRI